MEAIVRRTLAATALAVGLFTVNASAQAERGGPPEVVPHRINPHTMGDAVTVGSTSQIKPVIGYHGGPVMGIVTPYLIWYGNWNQGNGSDTSAGQQLVRDLLHGLNSSNYYKTNATYSSVAPNGQINPIGKEVTVGYTHGTSLSDATIQTIVSEAIAAGIPKDYSGVYFVITSSDVNESSGFCTQYCGWHTRGTIGGTTIKYSFVGNANRCLNACAMQSTGPNGNAGVDGMLSVITHELEEANTDPELNAWYNNRGYENADMCAWTFGTAQFQVANGAWANLTLPTASGGTRSYLIQRQLASDSKCYVDYPNRVQ
jgi:hypothetical protein